MEVNIYYVINDLASNAIIDPQKNYQTNFAIESSSHEELGAICTQRYDPNISHLVSGAVIEYLRNNNPLSLRKEEEEKYEKIFHGVSRMTIDDQNLPPSREALIEIIKKRAIDQ